MGEKLAAERVSPLKNFVAGGFGGACLLLAGHPLDTIKVTTVWKIRFNATVNVFIKRCAVISKLLKCPQRKAMHIDPYSIKSVIRDVGV